MFKHFLLQEFRYQYRSPWNVFYLVVSCFFNLVIYWFTSQALQGLSKETAVWNAHSYFEYLFLGEVVLLLPIAACNAFTRAIRYVANEGLLEEFFLHPRGPVQAIFLLALALLLPNVVYLAVLTLQAALIFKLGFSIWNGLRIAVLVFAALPLFLGVGLTGAAVFLRFGRGENLISHGVYVASIFAGIYFPLSVLPGNLSTWLPKVSPFTVLLETCRNVSMGRSTTIVANGITLLLLGGLGILIGFIAMRYSSRLVRKRGLPLFSHP